MISTLWQGTLVEAAQRSRVSNRTRCTAGAVDHRRVSFSRVFRRLRGCDQFALDGVAPSRQNVSGPEYTQANE